MTLSLKEYRQNYAKLLDGSSASVISTAGLVAEQVTAIASSMGINAEEFDMLSIPGISVSDGKMSIITDFDISAVNKAFFEFMQSKPKVVVESNLSPEVVSAIRELAIRRASTRETTLNTQRAQLLNDLNSKNSSVLDVIRRITATNREIDEMRMGAAASAEIAFQKIISSLKNDDYFTIVGVEDGTKIVLHTNDTILRFSVPGKDYSVNFGRFKVVVHAAEGVSIRWNKLSDNISVGSYYHPHINGSGEVCLGTASAAYHDALTEFDIGKALGYLKSIIHDYNPGSPYVRLDDFDIKYQEIKRRREIEANESALKEAFEKEQDSINWFDDEIINVGA